MAAVAPFSVEPKMGLNEEDEDMDKQLVALRLAALSTMKAKKASAMASQPNTKAVSGYHRQNHTGIKNNAVFKRIPNSNLISIVPISTCDDLVKEISSNKPTSEAYKPSYNKQPETKKDFSPLILPQHRYCKTAVPTLKQEKKRIVKSKFNRYESSSSDSSEESEDEDLAASGDESNILVVAAEEEDSLEKLMSEMENEKRANSQSEDTSKLTKDDIEPDPKPVVFEVEFANPVRKVDSPVINNDGVLSDNKKSQDSNSVDKSTEVPTQAQSSLSPVRHDTLVNRVVPYVHRSPSYRARSHTKSPPPYSSRPHGGRSRSRSRSLLRQGRSRSPRRYAPRRSVSPARRALSPHYLSPRRRSPTGGRLSPGDRFSPRRRSPSHDRTSPGRRRPFSPRRRASPGRPSPRRYMSPSPPRRHFSPSNRLSPRRWVSPRRRKSPSPVKRNPSPPRRFSPLRRSPLGRRVSPLRRNPSPPRKLYPLASQSSRLHSPRRHPLSPLRGPSPRRYNSQPFRRASPARPGLHLGSQPVGDTSPWTPPGGARPLSPRFNRRKSVSPRPRARRSSISPPFSKGDRKSVSPRSRRRRDSHSPLAAPRVDSISPKASGKRKSISPRRNNRRGSGSPRSDNRRRKASPHPGDGKKKSTSPERKSRSPRGDARRVATSPSRLATKRKSSASPRRRAGGRKQSKPRNDPAVSEHRRSSPSTMIRGADDHDSRTTKQSGRDKISRSISLSPAPDQVKKKSPLRLKSHRHERTNSKKKTKSKKSRDKTASQVPSEKTDKSSILEARRRKFENIDLVKPINKKIRLKTSREEPPSKSPELASKLSTEKIENSTTTVESKEVENLEDSLVLDSPYDLWSDVESDSDNEGRFKTSSHSGTVTGAKVGVLSFNNLLNPAAKLEGKGIKDRIGSRERRSPARDRKRRSGGIKDRLTLGSKRERIEETPAPVAEIVEATGVPTSPVRLIASSVAVDKAKAELDSKTVEEGELPPDPTERVSRLNPSEPPGDLRATLSLKRAARSAVLYPFKTGDKSSAPGTRLVQSAILDVMGKKNMKQLRSMSLKSQSGEITDSRRVTVASKTRETLKELMTGSVTLSADESTLTGDPSFTLGDLREGNARNRSIRLRLGLAQTGEEKPTTRKVKKLNRNNPVAEQV